MCNSILKQKLQTSGSRSPSSGPQDSQRSGLQIILRAFAVLLAVILLAHPFTEVLAGFPYKRVGVKSRSEGPVVPAPKNWGYRPTRWVRWETDIIHPALGPIAPDAKKEVKMPGTDQPGGAETDETLNASKSKSSDIPPSSPPGSEMLPPLPSAQTPQSLPNLDEDLPPLPGEDFNPPAAPAINPPPNSGQTQPENTEASATPSFRDPDAIFDKSDGQRKDGSPNALPPLPERKSPTRQTNPLPTKAEPAEPLPLTPLPSPSKPPAATPPIKAPNPPAVGPSDSEPSQWEKRTREKPIDPDALQKEGPSKAVPKKKPGEPFYDPESIFDERTGRRIGPAEVQWQKAGTTKQQTSERENVTDTDLTNAGTRQRQMPVFSPIKRTRLNLTNTAASQGHSSASFAPAALASPEIFEPQQPRPLRGMQSSWKATEEKGRGSATSTQRRQDHFVRPASFEQPVSPQQKSPHTAAVVDRPIAAISAAISAAIGTSSSINSPAETLGPTVVSRATTGALPVPHAIRGPVTPESESPTPAGKPRAVSSHSDDVDKVRRSKRANTKLAAPASLPAPSKPQRKRMRNPMRNPERPPEAVSSNNPLRERQSSLSSEHLSTQPNLENPLR